MHIASGSLGSSVGCVTSAEGIPRSPPIATRQRNALFVSACHCLSSRAHTLRRRRAAQDCKPRRPVRDDRPSPVPHRVAAQRSSDGQLHGTVQAATLALVVMVKEVDVQARLHNASKPDDALDIVVLRHVAVDPVDQVEPAVGAQRGNIVRREVFHLTLLLQQKELRQDGHSLEVNGEGPDHLERRVVILVDHQANECTRA
mmetsp:Transcript_17032/g.43746  ORF Transcript_17032/g.43746 Transcript_17032/m.43746 type:complete len:201 (-) Transcript_17032:475-1077(-)